MTTSARSRQPVRPAWTHRTLLSKRAMLLGNAIAPSSRLSYNSAMQSYSSFCAKHNFPIHPTADTLSFYITYMADYIEPRSITSYLSGIVSNLEPYYPNVRAARQSLIVKKTLAGALRTRSHPIKRKRALSDDDILKVVSFYTSSTDHDNLLFVAQLLTGFTCLLRLAELCTPDRKDLQDSRKHMQRLDVTQHPDTFELLLPAHKSDRFFEGSKLLLPQLQSPTDPFTHFSTYLCSRDARFICCPDLWLKADGTVPTKSWFAGRLREHFNSDISGHSMRAGGATSLALAGVPDDRIRQLGRWSSDAYEAYIRKHPYILSSILFRHFPTSQTPPS